MMNVQLHLEELLALIKEADKAIMEVYNARSATVSMKADNSPLTQADMASHHILTQGLTRIYPNIPIISEEGDAGLNAKTVRRELFWLIDPIDGTKEFLDRTGEFTICAALIEGDKPSFGIISAPALGATYYGGPGMGSYKKVQNHKATPIKVSKQKLGIVLGSRSHPNESTAAYIAKHFKGYELKQVGSMLKFTYIAEGLADACPRLDTSMNLWDLAAGQAIVEGAGGVVTRPDGSALDYHATNLKVGDFVAHF